jgi:IS5 family transposase
MPAIAAHNAQPDHKFKVYTSGQKRRVTPQNKREFKRRAAIEPVIGHLKEHHRMGRNYLAHASGDAINAVLAAAGYNFRRLLAWVRFYRPATPHPQPSLSTCDRSI